MNPRYMAAGLFSVLALGIIVAILVFAFQASRASASVWVMAQPVTAGQQITAADVTLVTIHGASENFVVAGDPVNSYATVNLQRSDILVPQDISKVSETVDISLTATGVGAAPGITVDIYYTSGTTATLIGTAVQVVGGSGQNFVVQVSRQQEGEWAAIAASSAHLFAVQVLGPGGANLIQGGVNNQWNTCDAVAALSGQQASACGTGGTAGTGLPASSSGTGSGTTGSAP